MDKGKTGHDTLERIVNALFTYIPPEDKQRALDKLNEIIKEEEENVSCH